MQNYLSRKSSLIILYTMIMLERFSFYGLRSIVVLYAISSEGLNLSTELSLDYYHISMHAVYLLPLPIGILTDLLIKQKRAIVLGGIISLAGYLTIIYGSIFSLILGTFLIILGTSFVKLNIPVLITRLFDKKEKKRDLSMVIFYLMINLGAFLSALTVAYIAENSSYTVAFIIVTFSTAIYLLIFLFNKRKIKINETNIESTYFTNFDNEKTLSFNWKPLLLISIVAVIYLGFIIINNKISAYSMELFSNLENVFIGNLELSSNILNSLISVFVIPLNIAIIIIWAIRGSGKTLSNFSLGFLLIGFSLVILFYISNSKVNISPFIVAPFFLLSLAELLISPLVFSYVTRICDMRFTSTIYGFILMFSVLALESFHGIFDNTKLIYIAITCFLLTFFIWLFKSRIYKLAEPLK